MHLAKRFYDMASVTSAEAYLPVILVLVKLYFESFIEIFFPNLFAVANTKLSNKEDKNASVDPLDSLWDIYLMSVLVGIILVWYTIRRQRPEGFRP